MMHQKSFFMENDLKQILPFLRGWSWKLLNLIFCDFVLKFEFDIPLNLKKIQQF